MLTTRKIYIFHHFPGNPVVFKDGVYFACDGIPRVVRQIITILAKCHHVEIIITAYAHQISNMEGYFKNMTNRDRVHILCINPQEETTKSNIGKIKSCAKYILRQSKTFTKSLVKAIIPSSLRPHVRNVLTRMFNFINVIKNRKNEAWYINLINEDQACITVLIPHYYWFPDALNLKKTIILYLPDYMPHFFHDTGEFAVDEGARTKLGRMLAEKAAKVFCNSNFTKSYLPNSRLKVSAEKIHVAYLPLLNHDQESQLEPLNIDEKLDTKPYIFYPTRPRPNKNLAFLLKIFEKLVENGYDINLVLTTTIECENKAIKVFRSMKHKKRILFLDAVTDNVLAYLYRNAALVCLTSIAEGNFPPQIHEALRYNAPIVAGHLEFITERIPADLSDSIILCEPNNETNFVSACKFAIENRESIIQRQKPLLQALETEEANTYFKDKVLELFNLSIKETLKGPIYEK